jgi:hypothetical protein
MDAKTLADSHLHIVNVAAIKYARRYGGDAHQHWGAAYAGILRAAEQFIARPPKGIPFAAHATRRAYFSIMDDARSQHGRRGRAKRMVETKPLSTVSRESLMVEPDTSVDEQDELKRRINSLAIDRRCRMALLLVAEGFTVEQASRQVGHGNAWLHQRLYAMSSARVRKRDR